MDLLLPENCLPQARTELLLCCTREVLVTKDAGSLFGLHLDSVGKHWLYTGSYVREIIVQSSRQ